MTFGPQGDVVTGAKFARRYADGGIRLVPRRNGVFELVISRVTTSDGGTYECNGTEWTHENGGKWIKIVENVKEMGTVKVIPTGKRSDIHTVVLLRWKLFTLISETVQSHGCKLLNLLVRAEELQLTGAVRRSVYTGYTAFILRHH